MPEWGKDAGLGERGEGLRSINWQLQNSHGAVKYSTGNIVSNIVITCVVPGGYWKYWGDT